MNLLQQLRFGGGFGGAARFSRNNTTESKGIMVRPSGFEPPTFCSGGKRSIQLSYGRTTVSVYQMRQVRMRRNRYTPTRPKSTSGDQAAMVGGSRRTSPTFSNNVLIAM